MKYLISFHQAGGVRHIRNTSGVIINVVRDPSRDITEFYLNDNILTIRPFYKQVELTENYQGIICGFAQILQENIEYPMQHLSEAFEYNKDGIVKCNWNDSQHIKDFIAKCNVALEAVRLLQ